MKDVTLCGKCGRRLIYRWADTSMGILHWTTDPEANWYEGYVCRRRLFTTPIFHEPIPVMTEEEYLQRRKNELDALLDGSRPGDESALKADMVG